MQENQFYTLHVAGLTRELPICKVDDTLSIAAFVMFSDVEMTVECAKALLQKVPEFDLILTAESKGIPLAYEMAKQSGKNYVLARKMSKLYMKNPMEISVKSITTARVQTLFLDQHEADMMKGKRLLIVDDVVITGGSLDALEGLENRTGANIVGKAFVLAEGDAADRKDIIYLEKLPLFLK